MKLLNNSPTFLGLKIAIYLILIVFLFACQTKEKQIEVSFYHWKSNLSLSSGDKDLLKNVNAKRLYIRFFDIDWDGVKVKPKPIAFTTFSQNNLEGVSIIPTVFITNKTMLNIGAKQIDFLTEKLLSTIYERAAKLKNTQIKGIQIDCDWTPKSKGNFFVFLKKLKRLTKAKGIELSATIRLHQLKYPKVTGVPPVDRGMLMFYNMGNLDGSNSQNSILDLAIAQKYLVNEKYTLPLDLALPIYSWGVLKRRGKVINLLNDITLDDFRDTKIFQKESDISIRVLKGTYLNGVYLYPKDLIRIESIQFDELLKSVRLIKRTHTIHNNSFNLTFYHIASKNIKLLTPDKIKQLVDILK